MPQYLVATGIRVFPVMASSPRQAICALKIRIDMRRYETENPDIGLSLVDALDERRLNFLVMDMERTQVYCGEFKGQFQQPVTRELADSLRCSLTDDLYRGITI